MSLVDNPATDTLPKLLRRNAKQWSGRPGMREKDRGIWQTYSWSAYQEHVRDFALGLAALGFKRGDKLAVVGDNRPRLYWSMLSAQALGGMAVPVYQDSIASELVYVLNHAEISVIVAEDQEQVDKALSLRDQLPSLKWIIFDDPRGLTDYDDGVLRSFAQVEEAGRAFAKENGAYYDAEVDRCQFGDVALIAYTSGTTGKPKGVLLTHRNFITVSENFVSAESVRASDNWLSYLPMAWVGDTILTIGVGLVSGTTANCPEGPDSVQRDLRELGPHALLAPPRVWETMLTQIQIKAQDASPLKKRVFEKYRAVAERRELLLSEGKPVPGGLNFQYKIGEALVYGPLRDQLGLRNTRWCLTGGAPLGAETFRFFRSIGINLKQVYGATEASALIAFQRDGFADPNSVGEAVPGVDVRVDDNGEVLVKSPGVFVGYYKQDDATREAMTADGWLKTGDAGLIDPRGQLAIIDRAKDVGKLDDGTPFAPQFIENKLKFSPFIREAVSFGSDRPFVTAMIAIDIETAGGWAERRDIAYTSYMDLSRKPEIAQLILDEVVKINASLPASTKVRRVLLLNKELEADDEEITRTRKVRRRFVAEKYAAVIEAFYNEAAAVDVTMDITFEDGRKSRIDSRIDIHDVPGAGAGAVSRAA